MNNEEVGMTDKQYDGHLLDHYAVLKRIRETAIKENAIDTVKEIEKEMKIIKFKLRPLVIPDNL